MKSYLHSEHLRDDNLVLNNILFNSHYSLLNQKERRKKSLYHKLPSFNSIKMVWYHFPISTKWTNIKLSPWHFPTAFLVIQYEHKPEMNETHYWSFNIKRPIICVTWNKWIMKTNNHLAIFYLQKWVFHLIVNMLNLKPNKLIRNHTEYKGALITISKLDNKTAMSLIYAMSWL